jgi:hypothetical protein
LEAFKVDQQVRTLLKQHLEYVWYGQICYPKALMPIGFEAKRGLVFMDSQHFKGDPKGP